MLSEKLEFLGLSEDEEISEEFESEFSDGLGENEREGDTDGSGVL